LPLLEPAPAQPASRPSIIEAESTQARNFFIFDTPFFSWIQVIYRTEMSVQQKHLCADIKELYLARRKKAIQNAKWIRKNCRKGTGPGKRINGRLSGGEKYGPSACSPGRGVIQ
ncbi:MAG: hypothetical protein KBG59_02865, partial [Lawsonibacter sp.]|nr:hypothetical protein [Lawsonibacter sp.]